MLDKEVHELEKHIIRYRRARAKPRLDRNARQGEVARELVSTTRHFYSDVKRSFASWTWHSGRNYARHHRFCLSGKSRTPRATLPDRVTARALGRLGLD